MASPWLPRRCSPGREALFTPHHGPVPAEVYRPDDPLPMDLPRTFQEPIAEHRGESRLLPLRTEALGKGCVCLIEVPPRKQESQLRTSEDPPESWSCAERRKWGKLAGRAGHISGVANSWGEGGEWTWGSPSALNHRRHHSFLTFPKGRAKPTIVPKKALRRPWCQRCGL